MNTEPGPSDRYRIALHVPWATIGKLLVAALIFWAVLKLTMAVLLFLLALVVSLALSPIAGRLERRGFSHTLAVAILALGMVVAVAAFLWVIVPPLSDQLLTLKQGLFAHRAVVEGRLAQTHPLVATVVTQILSLPEAPEVASSLRQPLAWGKIAVMGIMAMFLTVVVTFYLLLDGKRLYAWLLAYVPRRYRDRMATTVSEVSDVVIAYVQGQIITSLIYGAYSLAVLEAFRVPAAIPLALLAAFCDVIPVLGVVVSTVPAVLLALTVSPLAGIAVFILYVLYHLIENHWIVPRVYGRRLRLSGLAVLIALVIGGTLQGILGAILILPFVAAYPIVERVWLEKYLSDEVLTDHVALADAADKGTDEAVDNVLKGQEHSPSEPDGI
jgi:predicted PurR-regulated permease PerM